MKRILLGKADFYALDGANGEVYINFSEHGKVYKRTFDGALGLKTQVGFGDESVTLTCGKTARRIRGELVII